jgi:peptidoglycan/LPS O-acetylase OafA/YrhL
VFFWKAILAGPFWTLVLEWRWYFVFPLAIWLCRKSGAWLMLAVSIPLSALSMWLKFGVDMAWTINWTEGVFRYLPLFAFGMLASELAASGGRSAIELFLVRNCRWGLLLFLVILFAVPADENHSWQGTIQSTYTFGPLAFFATLAAVRDPFVDRILAWKPLVWVGSFSYSLYLLHGPFVLAMGAYFKTHVNSPLEQFLLIIVFTPLLMIPASYLFYLAFERPFLTRKFEKPGPLNVQVAAIPEAAAP